MASKEEEDKNPNGSDDPALTDPQESQNTSEAEQESKQLENYMAQMED